MIKRKKEMPEIEKLWADKFAYSASGDLEGYDAEGLQALRDEHGAIFLQDGDHGGMFFVEEKNEPGVWSGGTLVRPDKRGAFAVQLHRDVFDWMFANTNATKLQGGVSRDNLAAAAVARAASPGVKTVRRTSENIVIALTKDDYLKHKRD